MYAKKYMFVLIQMCYFQMNVSSNQAIKIATSRFPRLVIQVFVTRLSPDLCELEQMELWVKFIPENEKVD